MTEKSPLVQLKELIDEQIDCACCGRMEWEQAYELVEKLTSWRGLMTFLDEHYPESVFPTAEDRPDRDLGPRIISLVRTVNQLRAELDITKDGKP